MAQRDRQHFSPVITLARLETGLRPRHCRAPVKPRARLEGAKRADKENLMLILTRKVGETIMIGEDVVVKVLGVRSGQVKIGVQAPKELPVHRHEIFERIKAEGDDLPKDQSDDGCQPSSRED